MNILVAGATGTVGRHLVKHLSQAQDQARYGVRALTRHAANARFGAGVEVVQGDLTQPATLEAALEGVEAMHLINFNGEDYAALETGAAIVSLAERAGVKRATVLGAGEYRSLEQALASSSIETTILMPVEFMANVLDMAESIRERGEVRQPFSHRKSAMVHEADIAAVAAAALTREGHGGKSYLITGPEVLTPRDVVAVLGDKLGREIQFVELTEAEARTQWEAAGYPPETIEFFVEVYGNTPVEGYTVAPTVEQVTGRPPRSFEEWAQEHLDYFRPAA